MASERAASATAAPFPRVRSRGPAARRVPADPTSPTRRLEVPAVDMQSFISAVRESPSGSTADDDRPRGAWEPGDRGAVHSPATISRLGSEHARVGALADKVNVTIKELHRQSDLDRRRISQFERKVEARLDESLRETLRENDGREKWAEVQGSVKGLLEETQSLTRRIDGLDERIWARTSGAENAKQRHRELEQQVQAVEQQGRLQSATMEETQKRQATKLCRVEHSIEELARRFSKSEEDLRALQGGSQQRGSIDARFAQLEQHHAHMERDVRSLQLHLDNGLRAIGEGPSFDENATEQVQATKRGMAALERKVTGQIEELSSTVASLRVKLEGQLHRLNTLTERLETAHEPAIEAMREEFTQARTQDRREMDGEIVAIRTQAQEVSNSGAEAVADVREALRQVHAEIAALTLRPAESPMLRALDERTGVHEREVCDLRARFEALPAHSDASQAPETSKLHEDTEDLRRRLEWIEEQCAATAATEKAEHQKIAQVHNTVCGLVEQVSRLAQRISSGGVASSALQQQVQQLQQGLVELRPGDDQGNTSTGAVLEVQAKFAAVSGQVADLAARLVEVESGLEFTREREASMLDGCSAVSEVASSAPVATHGGLRVGLPLPPAQECAPDINGALDMQSSLAFQEKLEAVAAHLEVVDELMERVTEIERHLTLGDYTGASDCGAGAVAGGQANCMQDDDGASSTTSRRSRSDGAES